MSNNIPTEILDLVRFMCQTWDEIDQWAYKDAVSAIGTYPVIQGTRNQLSLKAIGRQDFDPERLHAAVRWMLDNHT